MRLLHWARPDVDIALLIEAAIESEGILLGPCPHDEIMRLVIALAQHARVLAIGKTGVHRRPDRKAGDQPAARDAIDHRKLFGDAGRRVVERQGIAHHAQSRVGGAARQGRGDQIGRGHQPVTVRVMLVDADRVKAAFGSEFELVHEVVVHQVRAPRVEQRGMDVHPHRGMLVAEILRELGVGHQVKPHQLHGSFSAEAPSTGAA
jgi:hypothetical protein